jgi:hypothetical protein
MRQKLFFIPLLLVISCCTIRETDEQSQKKISDLTTSNMMLRVREAQKDSVILILRDSLAECQQSNLQLHN